MGGGTTLDSKELVSVIIPTFNRAAFIINTLNSVSQQSYRPIEVLIVDDGSTDETEKVVLDWKDIHETLDFQINYIFQSNQGAPAARNNGIRNAKGKYFQFLDSDDILTFNKFELQIEKLQIDGTAICISDYSHVDENDCLLKYLSRDFTINEIISGFIAVLSSPPLINKEKIFYNCIYWNEKIKKLQDKDYFLKILMTVNDISYVNQNLFKWVKHKEEGITNSIPLKGWVYWSIFKSLLHFHVANLKYIKRNHYSAMFLLYSRLILFSLNAKGVMKILRYLRK